MERAATYSWYSVQNFHFSINTAVEAGHLSLQQFDQIKDRAQTFFTHATCLQLQPLLAFQPCLLKRATARKTPIAKSGITQASVTARYRSDIQENSPLPCLRCRPRNATMCETLLPNP